MPEKKTWKKISNETLYGIRLHQMTTEQYVEAKAFSLDTLLAFAFNKLDDIEKINVQKQFRENYCLFDRYLKIEARIEENQIESAGEYRVYLNTLEEKFRKQREVAEKCSIINSKNDLNLS